MPRGSTVRTVDPRLRQSCIPRLRTYMADISTNVVSGNKMLWLTVANIIKIDQCARYRLIYGHCNGFAGIHVAHFEFPTAIECLLVSLCGKAKPRGMRMGRIFVLAIALGAAGFAYNQYTGRNPLNAIPGITIAGSGGFAGGYGAAVGGGGSIAGSVKGLAGGVSNSLGN